MKKKINWQLPFWFKDFVRPARYKGIYGGRGSGKSESVARWFLLLSIQNPEANFLCVREIQDSIKDSVKGTLELIINDYGIKDYFNVLENVIYRVKNGERLGSFVFRGIKDHRSADNLKSMTKFDYVWIEEAHSISKYGWDILEPTIRKANSEIWATWNPDSEYDPIDVFFRKDLPSSNVFSKDDYVVKHVNYTDNKWFKDTAIYKSMLLSKENNYDEYCWKWLGHYNKKTKAQVFQRDLHYFILNNIEFDDIIKQKISKRLIAHGYIGCDWGTNDPMAVVKGYVDTINKEIYIVREFYQVGVEVDSIISAIRSVNIEKDVRHCVGDSSRPDLIQLCKRSGIAITPAKKGAGSVAEGISKLKRYSIYISENCKNLIYEFDKYSYKVDRDGNILNELLDKNNHAIDAIRYFMEKINEGAIE